MRAIVLSGGGAVGSYQIGFWKALRKLNITYDIVTGTSVGALNGALMVQNNYLKALFFWYNINYKDIFDYEKNKTDISTFYKKNILKGGIDVSNLEKSVNKCISKKNFFESKIDYGLITVKFPSMKHEEIIKKDLNEKNLIDYLIASASCFPAFKVKKVDGKSYVDGGFYDNLPINLAVKLGATEVIAVDLNQIGFKKHVKENVKVDIISPRNDVGSFLKFDKKDARRGIRFGYNDTMKYFKKLDGNKFTFKKNDLKNNYDRVKNKFLNIIYQIFDNTFDDELLKKHLFSKIGNEIDFDRLNNYIEKLGYIYKLDDSIIYSISEFNYLLSSRVRRLRINHQQVVDKIEMKDMLHDDVMVKYFLNLIDKKNYKKIKNLSLVFSSELIMAIYMKVIM